MKKEKTIYSVNHISGALSLRKPQTKSLEILKEILDNIKFNKNANLENNLLKINSLYPTLVDFERDFVSLTFALATGVGKTRLMGAFISYLYTNYNIKNYFVVAPNLTIFKKLEQDLGDPNNSKYVFKGLGCFNSPPKIITGDDYKNTNLSLFSSDINIYIFNIDKFNKESSGMRSLNEYLGESFFESLTKLDDLVLIMDESHHYRAIKGAAALNELEPLIGLELTATPFTNVGNKQELFKNVVYEYPLSKAIEDGYTRTPYAMTRTDIQFFNFGDEEIDKIMLQDGLINHENIKKKLESYAQRFDLKKVKPFMLVVCKDTEHAINIEKYIKSGDFSNGDYLNKTIVVHSKQRGKETEENLKLLLEVEKYDNPIEIVIHVNMLKEGWDVNNLYTIVPLRTASSKILREQMIGRGLRLPYGTRTNDETIDSVTLTAHDKFDELLKEAQKGNSIFKLGNIIKAEELRATANHTSEVKINFDELATLNNAYETMEIDQDDEIDNLILEAKKKLLENMRKAEINEESEKTKRKLKTQTIKDIEKEKDLIEVFNENRDPFSHWLSGIVEETYTEYSNKFIPIPYVVVKDNGVEDYRFADFDLDFEQFNHAPVKNEIIIQNLDDHSKRRLIKNEFINFNEINPHKLLLAELREKPEIDYEKTSELLFKLIDSVIQHYNNKYGMEKTKNIILMFKKDISNKIYAQMKENFYYENGTLIEEVISIGKKNMSQTFNYSVKKDLYSNFNERIQSVLFDGIKKGVFESAKFDSEPELKFAKVLERDKTVEKWLRPSINQFNIEYNNGKRYHPDFVVETNNEIFLVEVKGENMINNPDVKAKKSRALKYCEVVTNWNKINGYKPWSYLFIPSQQISDNSSFENLVKRFKEL